jgi:hypothetical protein
MINDFFPDDVCDVLSEYGTPVEIVPMHGLSHNRVWRVRFEQMCVVVKVNAQESAFYRHVAPVLTGVPIPKLLTSVGTDWLIIEFVPESLPRERWLADLDVIAALRTLHHITTESTQDWPTPFQPRWDDAMTDMALTLFPKNDRMVQLLRALQVRAQPLFQSKCWISGDPNPANWGVRQDGTVVLFDWERFGRGTPALDLAITIPGLGSNKDFQVVTAQYGDVSLTYDIALAKVWSVVEFLANAHQGKVADTRIVPMLVNAMPDWLSTLST